MSRKRFSRHILRRMPKLVPEQELASILAIVAASPGGVPVRVIREGLPVPLPVRMLQRRLALLVAQGRLLAEGQGKGRRYRVPAAHAALTASPTSPTSPGWADRAEGESGFAGLLVPLSPEGASLREVVRAPLPLRQPVGYRREFLDAYQPGVTFYLPPATRTHLLAIGRPPGSEQVVGTWVRTIYNRLLIDLSWNSSRLEGNTYSLLETERLLELGEAAEGKAALEAQMILNHKGAIEMLVEQAAEIGFNRYTLLNLHALLAQNLLADPQAVGRLRRVPVAVGGTVYHPPELPQLIEECFDALLARAEAIRDPFEQAFFALVHLAYLQAFEDVNKRVSRLAANIPLIRANLCPLSFVDVPEQAYIEGLLAVYELNRVELLRDVFVWACERSSARYSAVRQSLGEPDPFRLRYRTLIAEAVAAVVTARMDRKTATASVREAAARLPAPDRARFIEVVETELMNLHEGNIARFRLRPSVYSAWRAGWP
jgi:Fic family protein